MKKVLLLALVLTNFMFVKAQNYDTLYIADIPYHGAVFHYCSQEYDGVIIYGLPNWNCEWTVNGDHFTSDSIVVLNTEYSYYITYIGGGNRNYNIFFHTPLETSPFSEPVLWKRPNETITLTIEGGNFDPYDYEYLWSNGSNEWSIEVTQPGIYFVTITSIYGCGSETFSVEVRDNVEITLATCDLETNHNMVTWPTTSAQAEYVGTVEIKRDGMVMGTVNYSDGQFIDNIGSDAASRTYTVTAIATDGTPCPITSYPKETIHMAYLTGINNTIEVNWNTPTGYDLLGYNICEWHESDGSLSVIDYVGASVTSYTCSQSQFDQGYIVVQGVEAGKEGETRLLSNRSSETVGLGENGPSTDSGTLTVYPNPAQGAFTVEGMGRLSITNVLGQTVLTREIDGKETVELPLGIYFVKLNGQTRKIVVE